MGSQHNRIPWGITVKSFIELFTAAREVSTPLVAVRTFDPSSTIQSITASLGNHATVPLISWDSIHGLKGLNEIGGSALGNMATEADQPLGATVDLPIALGILEFAEEDVIAFIHNPHLVWDTDKKVIQAEWNLRNEYKANGNMLVNLIGIGTELPAELQQDTLILEEPLPTREELAKVISDTFGNAAAGKAEYAACKKGATPKVIKDGVDALIGLPLFPADQATAMSLDKVKGILSIEDLWTRKRDIVSANPGITYHNGTETLKDMYGVNSVRNFGIKFMNGKFSPTLILRQDEIEKQFAGNGTDSSGTKGNLLGEWLTWVNDRRIICSLFLGVPGSSKSHAAYCLGGEFGRPVINYSIPGMEHEHVGMSSKHQRTAHKVLDAISDGRIWLIATANSLNGLPPELVSRFQVGGIFFFDAPDDDEKLGILKLKIAQYKLDPSQEVPNMSNWTGRDVDNCARKSDALGISLVEASNYIVPLLTSHKEQMETLRQDSNGRYLSASKPGVYEYTKPQSQPTVRITDPASRKMR
jgi:hypothetical protein